eukprot:g83169.t1
MSWRQRARGASRPSGPNKPGLRSWRDGRRRWICGSDSSNKSRLHSWHSKRRNGIGCRQNKAAAKACKLGSRTNSYFATQHFELARRHEDLGRRELKLEQQKADVQRRARVVAQAKSQAKRSEERTQQARKEQEALSLVWQEQLNAARAQNGRASSSSSAASDGGGGCVIDTGHIRVFVEQHTTASQMRRQAPLLAVFPGERLYHTSAQYHVLNKNVYPRIYHPENRENYLLARQSLQHCPACECLAQYAGL